MSLIKLASRFYAKCLLFISRICLMKRHIGVDVNVCINRLTPNDPYMGLTAPLTSKRYILYIYSTNIGTEYFKYALYSPFFSLQNAVCFIMLTCWFLYYSHFIYRCAEIKKKIIPAPKG